MDEDAADFAAHTLSYYRPNNKSAAISWAQTFLSSQYMDNLTVEDLITTARKIERYLDGGTSV